ncbi:MAG: carbonic anhydrase [Opitutales bacterium]
MKELFLLFLICLSALTLGSVVRADTHMTAPEALTLLKSGNARFASGNALHPRVSFSRIGETAEIGQKPYATVLAASDSRVPLEAIFDQGIGDIFAIRVLGNVVDTDQAGSIEYGIAHLNTPLLVVLGNSQCEAVSSVAERVPFSGNLSPLLENIVPAIERAVLRHPRLEGPELLPHAIEENVSQSISDLLRISPVASLKVEDGELLIVGGVYQVESGRIKWLSKHPQVRMLEERGRQARHQAAVEAAAEAARAARLPRPSNAKPN